MNEIVITIIGLGTTVMGALGVTLTGKTLVKKKEDLSDLKRIREQLGQYVDVSEIAQEELEFSYRKELKSARKISAEVIRLKDIHDSVKESRRKLAIDKLGKVRNELYKISKTNSQASVELKNSYARRIASEKSAIKEAEYLMSKIDELRESERKNAFDDLVKLRNELISLSDNNDRARSELEDSYERRMNSEESVKKEVKRLQSVVVEIKDFKRKLALDDLLRARNELYDLSKVDSEAREELEDSYNRRITTEKGMKDEVERLETIVSSISNKLIVDTFEKLTSLRDELYNESKMNISIKRGLDDSFSKQILSEEIAHKEIERLEKLRDSESLRRGI